MTTSLSLIAGARPGEDIDEEEPDPIFECSFSADDKNYISWSSSSSNSHKSDEDGEDEDIEDVMMSESTNLLQEECQVLSQGGCHSIIRESHIRAPESKVFCLEENDCQNNITQQESDFDAIILDQAWEDIENLAEENRHADDQKVELDSKNDWALILHSEFVEECTQIIRTANSIHFIKYGIIGQKRIDNTTCYRPFRQDQDWLRLLQFLSRYLTEICADISYYKNNHPMRMDLLQISTTTALSDTISSSSNILIPTSPLALIPYPAQQQDWQLTPELQNKVQLIHMILLSYQAWLAESRGHLRRQHTFLRKLLLALESYAGTKDSLDLRMEQAQSLQSLAQLHHHDKLTSPDYNQAFVYYTQSLDIKSQLYGTDENVDLASSIENIGVLARDKLCNLELAIRCLKEALEMKYRVFFEGKDPTTQHRRHDREFFAEEYANVAQTLHSLGLAYDKALQYEEAQCFYQKALTMKKKHQRVSGSKNVNDTDTAGAQGTQQQQLLAATLFNLGCVSEKLGQLEEAMSYLEEAMQLQYEDRCYIDNPLRAIGTLVQVAKLYEKCNEMEGAYKYYKTALDLHYHQQQKAADTGSNNSLLIKMFCGLANVANQIGLYEEALFGFESLLQVLVQHANVVNLSTAAAAADNNERHLVIPTLYHLGLLNDVLGRPSKARNYYRVCLDKMMAVTPRNDTLEAKMMRMNLFCLSNETCKTDHKAAYELYTALIKNKYDHQDYTQQDAGFGVTVRNIAMLSTEYAHKLHDARDYYEQFLEIVWHPHRSCNHPGTSRSLVIVKTMHALGKLERKMRQYSRAKYYQNEALELLVLTKKRRVQIEEDLILTPDQVQEMANTHTAIEREQKLLKRCKRGRGLVAWMVD